MLTQASFTVNMMTLYCSLQLAYSLQFAVTVFATDQFLGEI